MQTHILGFPCIGQKRELKKALEGYWEGGFISPEKLWVNPIAALKPGHGPKLCSRSAI